MVTILLQQILDLLKGWVSSFTQFATDVMTKLNLIEEDTDNLSDIKSNTDDIKDNTGAVITPIQSIQSTNTTIASDTTTIKNTVSGMSNQLTTISANVGTASAFAEDCANNTLNTLDKVTTIASDTTQIRSNTNTVVTDLDKIYETLKWALVNIETTETVEGLDTVSFDTDLTEDLEVLDVDFNYTQSGTGDPSPNNIRPITGHSTMNLTVNGNNVSINLGDTYYKGTLDTVNGTLTIKWVKATTTSSNATTYGGLSSNGARFTSALNAPYRFANAICNMANIATNTTYTPGVMAVGIDNNQIYWFSIIDILGLSDLQAFKDWLDLNPVEVVYELAVPQVITLTPVQIATIKGINTISTDTNGNVEVTYKESVKHYLDKQEA